MLGPGAPVDLRQPPSELGALNDWFDRVSYGLVLLEEYPLEDLDAAVGAFEEGFRRHLESAPRTLAPTYRSDHRRFRTSLRQLRWFLAIVRQEDHGGHRQALGQYGRVLTEALRIHLEGEEALRAGRGRPPAPPRAGGAKKP